MKTGNLLTLALAMSVAWGCQKKADQDDGQQNPAQANNLSELTIASSFNWSSSVKGPLHLNIDAPEYLEINGQYVEIRTEQGEVVDRKKIQNGSVSFHIKFPQFDHKLFAHYPYTGESMEIKGSGNRVFKLNEYDLEGDPGSFKKLSFGNTNNSASAKTAGANLLVNGDFNQNLSDDDFRGTGALRSLGKWYRQNSFGTVSNVNGNSVFTSVSSAKAKIFQAVDVDPQFIYDLNFNYSGNGSVLVYFFNKNQKLIGYHWPNRNGGNGSTTIEVPANVEYFQVLAHTSDAGWLDNLSVSKVQEPDTDNDGIVDRLDDYPNDAGKAYASFYPQVGRQTIAFEDLWPSTGDFDFNDLVLSNLIEYSADTSGKVVEAKVKVMVNANGAGTPPGVAMVLLQPNGQPFSQNIISSMSGDGHLDQEVTNGVIVFDNLLQALNKPYSNNGQGPAGEPEEFEFTITFNSNLGNSQLLPDIYMFRAHERGREVHLDGFGPTAAADPKYFGAADDHNGTYNTKTGLPWAIEIIYPGTIFFKHPLEKVDILKAYPNFQQWAESNGSQHTGWMIHPENGKVYNF